MRVCVFFSFSITITSSKKEMNLRESGMCLCNHCFSTQDKKNALNLEWVGVRQPPIYRDTVFTAETFCFNRFNILCPQLDMRSKSQMIPENVKQKKEEKQEENKTIDLDFCRCICSDRSVFMSNEFRPYFVLLLMVFY